MVNSEIIYQYLLRAFSCDCSEYRLGQLIFNKVTINMLQIHGIENQSLAFKLASKNDKLFSILMQKEIWPETCELNMNYYRSNPQKALLLGLYKRAMQTFQHHSCLGILIEACFFEDSFNTPSELYHVEDKELTRGFERLLRVYDMIELHQFR